MIKDKMHKKVQKQDTLVCRHKMPNLFVPSVLLFLWFYVFLKAESFEAESARWEGWEGNINKNLIQVFKYTTFVPSGRTALALRFVGIRPQRWWLTVLSLLLPGSKKNSLVIWCIPRGTKSTNHKQSLSTLREAVTPVPYATRQYHVFCTIPMAHPHPLWNEGGATRALCLLS